MKGLSSSDPLSLDQPPRQQGSPCAYAKRTAFATDAWPCALAWAQAVEKHALPNQL